ncbi:efflux RND transporter periplasmic adaptor subunit [Terrarubrum flagellatum]|uniref:efflux RND transporter periplasmic adaptor subunit n=1 Tax=Terrirubrum flagellatum TaxID=2895980 RepID=UPI0031453C84
MRSWKIGLGAVIVAAGVGAAVHIVRKSPGVAGHPADAAPAAAAFVMPVPVTPIIKKTIPIYLEYSARTESIRNIALQAKASGYLQEQAVKDGADVKVGDLLYKIDQRDYQAALDQAKAQVERDSASLDYLRSNLSRGNELARSGYLAKDTFDQRSSAVRQAEAALSMSRAAVRTAELNLGYSEIRAPFDGRLGRNQAPVGTLVSAAGTTLNTLVQLAPIYVTFNPSESDLVEIQKARAAGRIEAEVLLPGEAKATHKGEVTFVDNVVERGTGTIVARATIENADRKLLPGQYVRIRLFLREQPDTLMAPQTALGSSQLGKYVYVVSANSTVEQRLVALGPTHGDLVAITKGVAEGDQVIDGNLQKIGPGAPVKPIPKQAAGS